MKFESLALLFLASVLFMVSGCATTPEGKTAGADVAEQPGIEEQWGIEIVGIRLTGANYFLDFRFRVIDPEKALPLLDHKVKPHLVELESGAKLEVPSHYKVGTLRTTDRAGKPPVAGLTYYMFFANPRGFIKPGSKVTVVIGDFRAENLVVE